MLTAVQYIISLNDNYIIVQLYAQVTTSACITSSCNTAINLNLIHYQLPTVEYTVYD